jgi:type I restriction enzyme M protein
MKSNTHNQIVNFLWSIADDVLRGTYTRSKYRDIILPMTVIRRLDALLEPTKQAVLNKKQQLDKAGIQEQAAILCQEAKQAFYNDSAFTLKDLKSRSKSQQLKDDFKTYLAGFSANVQDILDNFKFNEDQIKTLVKAGALSALIDKYVNPKINLSPNPVVDENGKELLAGLDNHSMGTIFEELIRRFSEDNNVGAGEHFTPRDVINLMADIIFLPIADKIESSTYLVYDGACGTGGMLTVADERLKKLAKEQGKQVSTHLYGQETQAETYAIAKSDLLIKGGGEDVDNIKYGSTLSSDAFTAQQFDFMLSNPPYGTSWKKDLENMTDGDKNFTDPRFIVQYDGEAEYKMVTAHDDGQLMFLVNKLAKMKTATKLGSRIAHVHNGSALFKGHAGGGESNIRRWIIENDWLEAIIALPESIFYNTPIATYIWLLTNKKTSKRQGKVQLIDATSWSQPLHKNMGKRNCKFTETHIKNICDLILDPKATEHSKIFANQDFGYSQVTVERPLRLAVNLDADNLNLFEQHCIDTKQQQLYVLITNVTENIGTLELEDYNKFLALVKQQAKELNFKFIKKSETIIRKMLTVTSATAAPVIKKSYQLGKVSPDALAGLFLTEVDGKQLIVEYEADSTLRDSEQIPLTEPGGVAEFVKREVLPYNQDAWVDHKKTKIGYEISFTKHFYKPKPMRTLTEIIADIRVLEQQTDGLLTDIIGEVQ